eukprot:SAG22_NODE_125_length_18883_cov_12.351629_23_plen_76_part_00
MGTAAASVGPTLPIAQQQYANKEKKTPQKKASSQSTYTGSELPIKIEDGVTLKVLELFSGTGSVGKIVEKIRGEP